MTDQPTWFQCPECGRVFSDGQPDPGRAWCPCGTSATYPEKLDPDEFAADCQEFGCHE